MFCSVVYVPRDRCKRSMNGRPIDTIILRSLHSKIRLYIYIYGAFELLCSR